MNFQEYIKPELLILVPVLYTVGIAIQNSKIDNKHIPAILGVLGVLLSGLWIIANSSFSTPQEVATGLFTAITQGILVAGASVYVNELFVQEFKQDKSR